MGAVEGTNAGFLADYVADVPGGMILMGGNIPGSDAQMREITAAMSAVAAPPPLIAIDQEGGDVARLPWDNFASALTLKNASSEETESAFAGRAALLAASGISVNFGVVADVPRGEGSFIYRRSYGTDPETVAAHVSAAVAGESGIVATTLKHFPGHGAAEGDSHHLIPETDLTYEEWRAGDAVPFAAGIDAGAELVMTGHLRFTAVADEPASLAPEWYRILREDLGFEGVAITDDLGMLLASGEPDLADPVANGVRAVAAGADVVLMIAGSTRETASEMIDGIVVAVENGDLSEARVEEAATRVLALRASAGVGSH
ncbi:glycoside hydrolase family 3 N-terminal domain-containing protein [Microbacterium amylolyticum]|nr:glycoside hydrolase family 3 N-terminal domain-containing protein [Microbacterium amylolyticum]